MDGLTWTTEPPCPSKRRRRRGALPGQMALPFGAAEVGAGESIGLPTEASKPPAVVYRPGAWRYDDPLDDAEPSAEELAGIQARLAEARAKKVACDQGNHRPAPNRLGNPHRSRAVCPA